MAKKKIIAIAIWSLLVVSILTWSIVSYRGEVDAAFKSEILLRHGLLMLVLSMPSGWLLTVICLAILKVFGLSAVGINEAIVASIACGIAGYFQWFVLLPWLWQKWKARTHRRRVAG